MSVEKAAKLFRSITEIDADLIADAAAGRKKQKPRLKWCAAAACVALMAVSVFCMMPREKICREDPAPFAGTKPIAAEGVLSVGGIGCGGGVRWAEYAITEGQTDLRRSPVKDSTDAAALPVYQTLYAKSSSDTYRLLLSWAEELAQTAQANLGMKLYWDAEDVLDNGEAYDDTEPTVGQTFYNMQVTLRGRDVPIRLFATSEGAVTYYQLDQLEDLYTAWAKEPLAVSETDDAELLNAVRPVISFVSDLTGEPYDPDTARIAPLVSDKIGNRILIDLDSSRISENELKRLTGRFLLPELTIRLDDRDFDGVYELGYVSVVGSRYEYIGDYPLISLEEAEAYLRKGYAFGSGYCPACLRNDPEVDFSAYDHVQVEYYGNFSEFAIPYYVFYKYVGPAEYLDGSGTYERYAVGYVPAVEVDGLETLFAEQEARHEADDHDAWREE